MTVEENISWSELLKHPIVTAEHGNDRNRFAAATESLQKAAHQFASALNDRAKLLANSAQYDTVLHDAAAIVTILPESGLGYLCMGDVHCQLGRYAAAISIYDEGLEAVPESDQYYQQLQQHRMSAITNNSKQVDFISQLPFDIVTINILPRMQPKFYCESSCEYLYVSRGWQQRILQQPNGLVFDFGRETDTFMKGHDQLVRFAPYVQKLKGDVFADAKLEDLFSRAHFSNLKHMHIYCQSTTFRLPLLNGLQLISDSLTHLAVDGRVDNLHLRDILESCPNLVSLRTESVDPAMVSLPISSCYPKITHLALHDVPEDTALEYDHMIGVLSRFPSLLSFEISPTPDSRVLPILHEYCPYLQVLYFGSTSKQLGVIDVHPHRKGIKSAHLGGEFGYLVAQGDLIQFLHVHRNSLEEVEACDDIDEYDSYWKLVNGQVIIQAGDRDAPPPLRFGYDPTTQAENSFMQLISIDFSHSESSTSNEFVLWLISNAPNLKAINLRISHLRHDITNAMIKLRHLSKLEIVRWVWGDHSDYYEGIIQFLEHHVGMGETSTLKEITISARTMAFDATWIPFISKLQCLKNLKLHALSIPEDCLPVMEKIGRGCPALEDLTLGVRGCDIGDGIISSLCQHSNLKCLRIGSTSLNPGTLILMTILPGLESLYLECNVPESVMEMLRKHVSKAMINKP
ncbi:hypothetical protein O0I10_011645 [Lichtheimia ornata]|uniref:Uncharacterized protein n=1 Tax=Lichtheimia ornata TaxID=688661 RepID=A0AAD7XSG0_9FUNG|nr:uncharacterized protein O0I10_011645 [Lichtheimia ornata]KAJ8652700.1 hypothetical protein O0I10_011645 [Lichtheimia ornata]